MSTDVSLMHSRRSLLDMKKINEEQHNQSGSNIIFSENTEADNLSQSDDLQNFQSTKNPSAQRQLLQTVNKNSLQSVWVFVINTDISDQNQQRIKKIYLCPESYKQAKILLPLLKFTSQAKKMMKKISLSSSSIKFKIVTDSYNASDTVQFFKSYPNVTQIYVFNDLKEDGLDQILPLKKKTNKIIGIFNSLSTLILKAEKEMDYQARLSLKTDNEGKQIIQIDYPNKFPTFSLVPNPQIPQNRSDLLQFNDFIARSIGLAIQEKKIQVSNFFSHLKSKILDSEILEKDIQTLEDLNHISPIVTEQRAYEILRLYLGLEAQESHQKSQESIDSGAQNLYDYISENLREKRSMKNLELGIYQIFHSIKQLSREVAGEKEESETFPENPNMATIDQTKLKQIQIEVGDEKNAEGKSFAAHNDHCYKLVTFPVDNLQKMVGKFVEIHEFCEFYSDLKTAQKKFNLEHSPIDRMSEQAVQSFTQKMKNKICLKVKLPDISWKSSDETFVVDYGILDVSKICRKREIQAPSRWKSVYISNIMSVFKVQKLETLSVNSNLTISTLSLNATSLQQIFDSDPNYLSINESKILNFYKRTNIFKALNGNYRQIRRQKTKKNSQAMKNYGSFNISSLQKVQRVDVRSHMNSKDFYMKGVLQITQNSSKVGPLPIQQVSFSNLHSHLETVKDEYILTGSRHENLKKKIMKLKENALTEEQVTYHNQKLSAMVEELYRFQEQLYRLKLALEDYHVCSYHLQNMETVLIKYPALQGEYQIKKMSIIAKRAEVGFRKGNLIEAQKLITSTIQPLYKVIERQEAESLSMCSAKYFRYVICSCCQTKDEKQELFRRWLGLIDNPEQIKTSLTILNIIGDLILLEKQIRHFLGSNDSQGDDMLVVVGRYLSDKLVSSLAKVQNSNQSLKNVSQYNRLIGLFTPKTDTKLEYYHKTIEMLETAEPFSLKSAFYYEQIGNIIKHQIISTKLNIKNSSTSQSIFVKNVNICLEFFEKSIGILECHKNTQIHLITNVNNIIQVLIALNQLDLVSRYSNDKMAFLLNKQIKSTVFRSQIAYFYYLLSLKAQIQGNFNLSSSMIHRALSQLENSLLKQNISTYQTVLKLSKPFFLFKFQQIKLAILMNKLSQNNFKDLKWLKQVYSEHYIQKNHLNFRKCELYLKFYQIQALYWLHKSTLKLYYSFTFKQILVINHARDITQTYQTDHIAFKKLCVLALKFLTKQKICDTLMKKIELLYFQAVQDKSIKLSSVNASNPDHSLSNIQPSFDYEQNVKGESINSLRLQQTKKQQNWQNLYWKYHFIKGLYLKTTNRNRYQQSLKSFRKAIKSAKNSHFQSNKIELKIYQRNKQQLKKMDKSMKKVPQTKRYKIFVYEVELKYIISVIECITNKIFLDVQDVQDCQKFIQQIFLVIHQEMESTGKSEIEEVNLDDYSQNRLFEIGSDILKYLTVNKILDERQNKTIQQQIKFYSTPQNLANALRQIFEPIYRQIDSTKGQNKRNREEENEAIFKEIVTGRKDYEQKIEQEIKKLNEQAGVYESEEYYDEMFQKLTVEKL